MAMPRTPGVPAPGMSRRGHDCSVFSLRHRCDPDCRQVRVLRPDGVWLNPEPEEIWGYRQSI
jgi:hypothetical protein